MVRLALGIILLLSCVSCNSRPTSLWPTTPQFVHNNIWEIYHDPGLTGTQLLWIRQSLRAHVSLSDTTYFWPVSGSRAPRWMSRGTPYTKPKIYFYNEKVQYLNSSIRIGVKAYADFKKEEVHAVVGHKFSCPGLARAVHQLRCGPDPWEQDPSFNWQLLITQQNQLVKAFEKHR